MDLEWLAFDWYHMLLFVVCVEVKRGRKKCFQKGRQHTGHTRGSLEKFSVELKGHSL